MHVALITEQLIPAGLERVLHPRLTPGARLSSLADHRARAGLDVLMPRKGRHDEVLQRRPSPVGGHEDVEEKMM